MPFLSLEVNSISVSRNDYLDCHIFYFKGIQALMRSGLTFLKVVSFMRDFTVLQVRHLAVAINLSHRNCKTRPTNQCYALRIITAELK